ncbi:MAG: addiction module toxin, HicA family [Sphingomonadales bacterium]|nr:addiction module toxin, HicA family [Sphingomonadales bacterium]NCP50278.1 addiction module toxin, HicA family [Sphingomonadales bacterium]PIX67153.1 MAG: addiction module toxin, HicA family [Sphingomonadales bacterium CG_4_10_14_3_um_filter_58_15]
MRSREVLKRLKRSGWQEVRQSGSHKHLRHPDHPGTVTVPHPKADLPIGTLKSIERQSGVDLRN